MKIAELRVLEKDELDGRMRTARRELYELRFKHAVGQLENSSQIAKVRHDIARILTVLSERELGIEVVTDSPEELVAAPAKPKPAKQPEFVEDEEPAAQAEDAEPAAEPAMEAPVVESEPAKPKRGRKTKEEKS